METENYLNSELTEKIIRSFFDVYNKLGYGFLEKVYENALKLELEKNGCCVECQKPINVLYEGKVIGDYYADMVVDNLVIVEIKACEVLNPNHQFQLQNYLRATNLEVGLLVNFGHKPQFVRRVFSNKNKKLQSA